MSPLFQVDIQTNITRYPSRLTRKLHLILSLLLETFYRIFELESKSPDLSENKSASLIYIV